MSAVRKDSPAPAAPAPPSALECAKRFLSPEQFATLETIVTLRELPNGRADWSMVVDQTGLTGDRRNPLAGLQPYLWLLVAILHISQRLSWAEIAQHHWIVGGLAPSTIYNKRAKAPLPIGLTLESFIDEYRKAHERAAQELVRYHAQQDAEDARELFRASLQLSKLLIDDLKEDRAAARELEVSFEFREPSDEEDSEEPQQAALELLDSDGRPMEPREAARQDSKATKLRRRLGYSDTIAKALQRATAVGEGAHKNLRLIHGQSTENVAEVEADAAIPADFDLDRAREEIERLEAEEAQLNARLAQLASEADDDSDEPGEDG